MARKNKREQEMLARFAADAGGRFNAGIAAARHTALVVALGAFYGALPTEGMGFEDLDYLDRAKAALDSRGAIPAGLLRQLLAAHVASVQGLVGVHDEQGSSPNSIWRIGPVMRLTGLSRSTIWRLEQSGKFPKRVRLSGRSMGWLVTDVKAWLEARRL